MPRDQPCFQDAFNNFFLVVLEPKALSPNRINSKIYGGAYKNKKPRMYLIENGYFGNPDPAVNSLHQLLVVAFRDFKSFQKEKGLRCSQTKFVPNFASRQPGKFWCCKSLSIVGLL